MEETINSYLTFKVNGGVYGVHVSHVVEILAYENPKARACAMSYVLGLIAHRDTVVPLIDSGAKFNVGPVKVNDQTYVVVISVNNGGSPFEVALVVDEVNEVVDIPEEDKKQIETSYKPGYVDFAVKIGDKLGLILHADKVFSDSDIVSIAQWLGEQK